MWTRLFRGSNSQPSLAPFSMYSVIFLRTSGSLSDGDRNSTTKSGQTGASFSCCSRVKAAQRLSGIQDASGARFAPFGSEKPADDPKQIPVPSVSVQFAKRWPNFNSLHPVFDPG